MRAKRYKFKSIDAVTKTLNLTERINSKVNGIHFGRNREEVEENMKRHKDYLRGMASLDFKQRNDSSDKSPGSKGSKVSKNDKGANFEEGMNQLFD